MCCLHFGSLASSKFAKRHVLSPLRPTHHPQIECACAPAPRRRSAAARSRGMVEVGARGSVQSCAATSAASRAVGCRASSPPLDGRHSVPRGYGQEDYDCILYDSSQWPCACLGTRSPSGRRAAVFTGDEDAVVVGVDVQPWKRGPSLFQNALLAL
eukprot:gene12703-biopygen12462